MADHEPARPVSRRIPWVLVACLLLVGAVITAAVGDELLASSPPMAGLPTSAPATASLVRLPRSEHAGALGMADGAVPDGTTVFDDNVPGVANLDSELLGALRQAATDAGIDFIVDSGWRSPRYQEKLLRDAVSKYGSETKAARWVGTPETSAHVSGHAVDVGPSDATVWLAEHGATYGLCQIYRNEPWHYELRREATAHGCPPMYADPAHDPRMNP
jgi:hypothetical protein